MKQFTRLYYFINYFFKAKSIYKIHSPFLYQLATTIFTTQNTTKETLKIEMLRKELKKNKKTIVINNFAYNKPRYKKISKISKTSLTSQYRSKVIFQLIKYFNAKKIIELGTNLGINTLYMSVANPKATIFSIEACSNLYNIATQNIKKTNVKNIQLKLGTFDNILPNLLNTIKQFDLIYIDGNHQYKATIKYFFWCLRHKHQNSIIIFDDIYWSKEMKKAWTEITQHKEVSLSINYFFSGIIFFKPELSKENFIFKHKKILFNR